LKTKALIIGSGFAGLSAASHLAKKGYQVTILEKNDQFGGRARSFSKDGFTFDMGPSWYWMPDVFDSYFENFGKQVKDYYELERLDPSYRVYFDEGDYVDMPASLDELYELFDSIEAGAGEKLRQFLSESAYKYEVGINDLVYKPGRKLTEFADMRVVRGLFQLHLLKSMRSYVQSYFKNEKLRQLMEFPILFLGGTPENTPALYSLMNYADMALGTWYPKGGMHKIVEGMVSLAKELGVSFYANQEVEHINVKNAKAVSVQTKAGKTFDFDVLVAGADYHHVEQRLLDEQYRTYKPSYWDKRAMAPSSLLYYLGIKKKLKNIQHHTLFFDADFDKHAAEIYSDPKWPESPLFYVSCTSKTDPTAAPDGCENLFLLMPIAPDLKDDESTREEYYVLMMKRLEDHIGESVAEHVVYKRSYAVSDFKADYHSFKGNAYGLANTLRQTAILKPSIKNKKVQNMFYTGQLTVPGPGVPPSLISGEVVANEIAKEFKLQEVL
jgi:phytoene desaturase